MGLNDLRKLTLAAFALALLIASSSDSHAAPEVIPLWANGAPGFESRRGEPEEAEDYWVRNMHNPSITAYLPPADKATGAAVIVVPGGGHRELVFDAEGRDAAEFLNQARRRRLRAQISPRART